MIKIWTKLKVLLKGIRGIAKWIGYAIAVIFCILFIIIGSANNRNKKTVKENKAVIAQLQSRIDTLQQQVIELGKMDAVRVDVKLEMKNTNVLGITNIKAEQIAHTIATYTRKDVLDSMKTETKH